VAELKKSHRTKLIMQRLFISNSVNYSNDIVDGSLILPNLL